MNPSADRRIAIVTDSVSQLPPALAERHAVTVVPVTVTIDGVEYREGVDLDADTFWHHFDDATPEVATSQPSPGAFLDVYRSLLDAGATDIVSIHVSAELSGTLNSARIAATSLADDPPEPDGDGLVDQHRVGPVRLVDTGALSFGIACSVWAAAEALAGGGDAAAVAAAAEATAPEVRSTFILQALDFTRAQGRLVDQLPADADDVAVFEMAGADMDVIGSGRSVDELAELLVAPVLASGRPVRVGIGLADATGRPFTDAMERRLVDRPEVVDLVHYRVGPSVGAYTGPGTAGGYWFPAER